MKLLAFKTIVTLGLEYASQVWWPHTKRKVDKQSSAETTRLTFWLGLLNSVSNCAKRNGFTELIDRTQESDLKPLDKYRIRSL